MTQNKFITTKNSLLVQIIFVLLHRIIAEAWSANVYYKFLWVLKDILVDQQKIFAYG